MLHAVGLSFGTGALRRPSAIRSETLVTGGCSVGAVQCIWCSCGRVGIGWCVVSDVILMVGGGNTT